MQPESPCHRNNVNGRNDQMAYAHSAAPDPSVWHPLQALLAVITDPLGTPLFDVRMAALGLPVTAAINSVTDYWGDSITDQLVAPSKGAPPMSWLQMAGLFIGIGVLAAIAAALSVVFQKRRQRAAASLQLQTTPRLSHHVQMSSKVQKSVQSDVETAGASCESELVMCDQPHDEPLNQELQSESSPLLCNQQRQHQQPFPAGTLDRQQQSFPFSGANERQPAQGAERLSGRMQLEASSYFPFSEDSCSRQHGQLGSRNCSSSPNSGGDLSLSPSQFDLSSEQLQLPQGHEQSTSSSGHGLSGPRPVQLPGQLAGLVQAWVIDPGQIRICEHPKGGPWQLGSGSFGVVSTLSDTASKHATGPVSKHIVIGSGRVLGLGEGYP